MNTGRSVFKLRALPSVWLVAVAALAGGCHDPSEAAPAKNPTSSQWFTEITHEVGLRFIYDTGATGELLFPEIMGSGAALFDYDGDGDLDIYLTNGARCFDRSDTSGDLVNRLYRQDPDGRFVDVTEASGLGDIGYGMGVAIGDIDNDGDADVYVTNYGLDRLYENRGDGTFDDVTAAAGIHVDGWSCSAAFFDYDLDGFLDLYVTRYVTGNPAKYCFDSAGRRAYCGPKSFIPVHDILLHNNGDGTFTDATEKAGIAAIAGNGLGVICEDLNGDGWPDVYVANDASPNQLWINQHDGTFRDDAIMMGAAYNMEGQAEAGMGVLAADVDGDLDFDLFMTHLRNESNTLYLNLGGDAGFDDTSASAGLATSSMRYTGFGTAAFDVELDGDLDIVVVNGRVARGDALPGARVEPPWDIFAEPNLFYLNNGSGRFDLIEQEVATLCAPIEISRGLAAGDIDEDGDLDLLISNLHGPARLYRNEAPRKGHWLIIRAIDPRLRRDAIGARITISCGGRQQVRSISRGHSYLSSSDPRAHFGVGPATRIDQIDVRWPDGLRERFPATPADRVVELIRGAGERPS
ncbi:MAG: CRTAC1 family protein [Planctomycetes bacterium]|nr:CRTAC1 family protein [Planctomycetota bacterium]